MSKGKKALKVIGIIFGGLIGLIIVVHIVLNIIFSVQLNNKFAELKSQGRPMTIAEVVPPPVPDGENAAVLYNKAFVLMTSGEGGNPYIPNKEGGTENNVINAIRDIKSPYISEWTDEQRREIPRLVDSKQMQDIYKFLEEGSQKPKCRFNREYEKGPAMIFPELNPMRDAVRFLCIKALLEAESGKTAEAFDTLLIGLKISNHLKDEPILISQLVRIACDGMIIDHIKIISDSKVIPVEKATLIMNELSVHQGVEPFIKCMDGERVAFGMFAFEEILQGKMLAGDTGGWILIKHPLVIFAKPIFKKDFVCYLTLMSKMRFSYDFSSYKVTKDNLIDEQIPRYCIFTNMFMPALNRVRENAAKYQANIDVCRVGLALKLYKAKNGNYPEGLESLVSANLLREVPIDPFSGKGLVYSRYVGGFKLYSFGPNMQDDFGTPQAKKSNVPAYKDYDKDYDIVWQSES